MSSKLFRETVEFAPVVWRHGAKSAAHSDAPDVAAAGRDPHGESLLRARIAELEAAADTRSRQAYETGLHAGEEAAVARLQAEVGETLQRLVAAIADVSVVRAKTIRQAEADTVRLAIEIARRVLHREVSVDRSALEALVYAALTKLQGQEVLRVRVHPDHEKLVRACLEQNGRGESVAVLADPLQPLGGAIFETGRGALDASIDTQLGEIERGLIDQLENRL